MMAQKDGLWFWSYRYSGILDQLLAWDSFFPRSQSVFMGLNVKIIQF